MAHGNESPSAWVQRWSHLVPVGGSVLDLACGQGRHMRWFAQRGHAVTGVDRSADAIAAVAGLGRAIEADIENGPWPLDGERFDAVSAAITVAAAIALFRFKVGVIPLLGTCAMAGLGLGWLLPVLH